MRPSASILLVWYCTATLVGQTPEKVNQGSLILQDFSKRMADYVALHKSARSEVHALKPTASPEAIVHYQHELAHRIVESRRGAAQGAIFTPEIAAEFRRLLQIATQGSDSSRVRQSLNHAEPVSLPPLRINAPYPENLPLQSTPPSVLQNLPQLPQEVEYRFVSHDLVLRDVDANLIVDFIRSATQ